MSMKASNGEQAVTHSISDSSLRDIRASEALHLGEYATIEVVEFIESTALLIDKARRIELGREFFELLQGKDARIEDNLEEISILTNGTTGERTILVRNKATKQYRNYNSCYESQNQASITFDETGISITATSDISLRYGVFISPDSPEGNLQIQIDEQPVNLSWDNNSEI